MVHRLRVRLKSTPGVVRSVSPLALHFLSIEVAALLHALKEHQEIRRSTPGSARPLEDPIADLADERVPTPLNRLDLVGISRGEQIHAVALQLLDLAPVVRLAEDH